MAAHAARRAQDTRSGGAPASGSVGFLGPLRLELLGPQRWLLIDPLRYRSELLPGTFVVPRGFQTDLASIPRWLWTVAPKTDRYDPAAVLHDAAYAGALRTDGTELRIAMTKVWADRLFYEALIACRVGPWRARLMYLAVSAGGTYTAHPLARHREHQ